MKKAPSIELSNFQPYPPTLQPLDLPDFPEPPVNPEPVTLLIEKQNMPQPKPSQQQLKKLQKKNKLYRVKLEVLRQTQNIKSLQPLNKQAQKGSGNQRQARIHSLPVELPQKQKTFFRIHNKNQEKNTYSLTKYQPFFSKDPQQENTGNNLTKSISVEGRPLLGKAQGYQNESLSPSRINRTKSVLTKTYFKKELAPSASMNGGGGANKEVKMLISKAKNIILGNQLFKLPKDKEIILNSRLGDTIKSDIKGRSLGLKMEKQADRKEYSPIFRKGAKDELIVVKGEGNGYFPKRQKNEQYLSQLKSRMGGQKKVLILR